MKKRLSLCVLSVGLLAYAGRVPSGNSFAGNAVSAERFVANVRLGGASQNKTVIYETTILLALRKL